MNILGHEFSGPFGSVDSIRAVGGIYAILDRANVVKDVGEAGDLNNRLRNHDRRPCWERHAPYGYFYYVLYTGGWTPEQRRTVEGRIRDHYKPPCGDR